MDNIQKLVKTELGAWPVVSSALFDFASSDNFISIVGRAGLTVDWNLTVNEEYSHSTRKRAYLPRLQTAYSTLNTKDRITALSIIAAELAQRYPAQSQNIKLSLERVGWTLNARRGEEKNEDIMKRDKTLQRLLLLQLRDGKAPSELANYPEQEQVYNSALLIEDNFVNGEAIRDGDGKFAATVMTELTSKGHDYLEQTDNPVPPLVVVAAKNRKLIFVSHAHADTDLANALLELLCSALHLRVSDFVCTSVEGAKLRGGDEPDKVLRQQIQNVPAFLSLLTPAALKSNYVLFELGARWGWDGHHIPLLAKGSGTGVIKDPLKKIALQLGEISEVLQLVVDLGHLLGKTVESAHTFHTKALKVVEIAKKFEDTEVLAEASNLKENDTVGAPSGFRRAFKLPQVPEANEEKFQDGPLRLLRAFAKNGNLLTEQIYKLDISRVKAEHYLDVLEEKALVSKSKQIGNQWNLTALGRETAVRMNLT